MSPIHRTLEALHLPPGVHDIPCPACGPSRDAMTNRSRRVMRVWNEREGVLTYNCARCGIRGGARTMFVPKVGFTRHAQAAQASVRNDRREVALKLWEASRPARDSIVEEYLRWRGIGLIEVPATLRYLAPRRPGHHPALIAPFGFTREPQPGHVSISRDAIHGVHLTFLAPDGLGKAQVAPAKIMIARSIGTPIVVAPLSDSLGLAIAEGIEDAISIHEATGLGAWAAGSAGRLPALAAVVPCEIESVTVVADSDDAGYENACELAHRLNARGFEVTIAQVGRTWAK